MIKNSPDIDIQEKETMRFFERSQFHRAAFDCVGEALTVCGLTAFLRSDSSQPNTRRDKMLCCF
jgi:hypothetical protein